MHKLGARGWLAEDDRRHSLAPAVTSLPEDERRDLAVALCGPSS